MKARRIRGADQLASVATEWSRLAAAQGGCIEQIDWVASCAATVADGRAVDAVTLWEGDRLLAAAPLATRRVRGVRRRVLLGMAEYGEPMSCLGADDAALERLAAELVRNGVPFALERTPADAPFTAALTRAAARRGVLVQRPAPSSPYLTLDGSWTTPEDRLNSGRRSDLRRARRRAEEQGPVETTVYAPGPGDWEPLFDEAFAIEAKSWKGTEGTALNCDPVRGRFFRELAERASRSGALRIALLRIGGRIVAMQFALVHGGRYWLLKVGYDPEFARCSPGVLLLRDTIAHAAQSRLTGYEFLGRDEPWIDMWSPQRRECTAIRVYPYSLQGLQALAADGVCRLSINAAGRASDACRRARGAARRSLQAVMGRAARKYISGERLADAERVRQELVARGLKCTIGFWDGEGDSPRTIADQYLAGIDRLATSTDTGDYVSIKLPSLGSDERLLHDIADRAARAGVRLHFDSLGIEHTDRTLSLIEAIRRRHPQLAVSITLPARWSRSVRDAQWAQRQGIGIRVVKGQWADPDDPERDPREGFLEIVQQASRKAVLVSVASHDVPLAAAALRWLQTVGAPCDLELLYGLPMSGSLEQAQKLGVPVRVYVPYGAAYLPYVVGRLRENPHIAWWLAKDALSSCLPRVSSAASSLFSTE